MLASLADNIFNLTHILIITKKTTKLFFSHCTGHKFANPNDSGTEIHINLIEYLKNTPSDIIVLSSTRKTRVPNLPNAQFSQTDALQAALNHQINYKGKRKFNCGTYIAKILKLKNRKKLALPHEWLNLRFLTPKYIFTYSA